MSADDAKEIAQLHEERIVHASKILKGEPNWPEVPLAKLQWSVPTTYTPSYAYAPIAKPRDGLPISVRPSP